MLTSIHPGSFDALQLGSGLFLKNFEADAAANADQLYDLVNAAVEEKRGLIGATRDGGRFRCMPRLRSVDMDGLRGPTRGDKVADGWDVTLSGTMMEITPENMALALGLAEVTHSAGRTTVRPRTQVTEDDYVPSLCWVGNTTRGAVLIELSNVLNVSGAAFSFGDRTEGALPFTFQAHAAVGDDLPPCRVIFFREAARCG